MNRFTKRLTRNTKTIIVVGLLLAVASFAFYTSKQVSALNTANNSLASTQASLSKLHTELATAEAGGATAISQLSAKAATAKLVLPTGPLPNTITTQVYDQAQAAGLQVTSFSKQTVAQGPNRCLSYQPFSMTVTGSLSSLINWVTTVESFSQGSGLPLITLSEVSLLAVASTGTTDSYTLSATLKAWSTSTVPPAPGSTPSAQNTTSSC
jgi:Tfp pilus assembly protein PilO